MEQVRGMERGGGGLEVIRGAAGAGEERGAFALGTPQVEQLGIPRLEGGERREEAFGREEGEGVAAAGERARGSEVRTMFQ